MTVLSNPTLAYNRSPKNLTECEEALTRLRPLMDEERIRYKFAEAKYAGRLKGVKELKEQLKSLNLNMKNLKSAPVVSVQEFINIKAAIYRVTEALGGMQDDAREIRRTYINSKKLFDRYQEDLKNITTLTTSLENNLYQFPYVPRPDSTED